MGAIMIRNPQLVARMEKEFISKQRLTYDQSMQLYEAMWSEGVRLGVLPPRDRMEGIDVDIRVAEVLNSCSRKSSPS